MASKNLTRYLAPLITRGIKTEIMIYLFMSVRSAKSEKAENTKYCQSLNSSTLLGVCGN